MTTRTASQPQRTSELLNLLNSTKSRFTPSDRQNKISILRTLRHREIQDVPSLTQFHEILCFLRAYPDGPKLLRLVEEAVTTFPARVDLVKARGGLSEVKKLQDTGIAHTTVYYPFPHPIATWLAGSFPENVEIDWEDEEGLGKIRAMLSLVVAYAENDALDDEHLSLRDWVRAAKPDRELSDLQWLLELLDRSPLSPQTILHLYNNAELLLGWDLQDATASRTQAKFPVSRIFYHRSPLKRGQIDFSREIQKSLPALPTVSRKTARSLIHLFRSALSVRNREFHPLTHANPLDVLCADVGRGLRIVLVGAAPEFRLPLEGYYSFLVLKNGVPVSYGGGGALFDRLEIAANIFESFRQGESVFIYSQILRVFRQVCRSRDFLVKRYQVGYENAEAIESGAFWFYHKLGFRPTDPSVCRFAEEEHRRIQADPAYRSSRTVLEKLAESDMVLSLNAENGTTFRDLQSGGIGRLVSHVIAQRFDGNRAAAIAGATQQVAQSLRIARWREWPAPEQMALQRLSPVLALIPDLAHWTPAEKHGLVRVIRAKGARREFGYIRLLRGHLRLRRSLFQLADSASSLFAPPPS